MGIASSSFPASFVDLEDAKLTGGTKDAWYTTSPRLFCVRTVAFHVRRAGSSSDSRPQTMEMPSKAVRSSGVLRATERHPVNPPPWVLHLPAHTRQSRPARSGPMALELTPPMTTSSTRSQAWAATATASDAPERRSRRSKLADVSSGSGVGVGAGSTAVVASLRLNGPKNRARTIRDDWAPRWPTPRRTRGEGATETEGAARATGPRRGASDARGGDAAMSAGRYARVDMVLRRAPRAVEVTSPRSACDKRQSWKFYGIPCAMLFYN